MPQNRGMFEPAAEPRVEAEPIVYEQPLNERMRTFLRLDFLYSQTMYHEERTDSWTTRAAMNSLALVNNTP